MPDLRIPINCGAETCATKPGEFCRYLRVSHFGARYSCRLFSEPRTVLGDAYGWLQRHPDCLKYEITEEKK